MNTKAPFALVLTNEDIERIALRVADMLEERRQKREMQRIQIETETMRRKSEWLAYLGGYGTLPISHRFDTIPDDEPSEPDALPKAPREPLHTEGPFR